MQPGLMHRSSGTEQEIVVLGYSIVDDLEPEQIDECDSNTVVGPVFLSP